MHRRCARFAAALFAAPGVLAGCAAPTPGPHPWPGAETCRPAKRIETALADVRRFMVVRATINGGVAPLLVDTGAETSTLTPRAVAALHLRYDRAPGRKLAGVIGDVSVDTVPVSAVALNGAVVATAERVAVGALPPIPAFGAPVAGLLGADVLARFDLDLDLPAGRLTLYARATCPDFLPWAGATPVPFHTVRAGLVGVEATVDGRPVAALLDTGARTTLLTRAAAHALGVTDAMLREDGQRVGTGIGPASVAMRRHRFASIGLAGTVVRDMEVNVADVRLPGVAMLLGADFLGPREIWISYGTGRLFLR